jgi:hypothetical protein
MKMYFLEPKNIIKTKASRFDDPIYDKIVSSTLAIMSNSLNDVKARIVLHSRDTVLYYTGSSRSLSSATDPRLQLLTHACMMYSFCFCHYIN